MLQLYAIFLHISFLSKLYVAGHINNQYNTPFWCLVKSGKTPKEAQLVLKVNKFFLLERVAIRK